MPRQNVDFAAYYNNYLASLKVKVKDAVNRALRDTWADFFVVVEDKIQTMFNSVIQDFYASYSPDYYNRNESLYDILQTSVDADSLSIWFDPGRMSSFRSGYTGEDGLYDQVFRHGWHGGAGSGDGHPAHGRPYWRTPIPYYNRWGREASMSMVAPLEDMKRRVADYEQYGMQADFDRVWAIHAGNITIDA